MEESQRISWTNFATENINLRYPVISIQVISPFNYTNEGSITMSTFVASKDKERLTLVIDKYYITAYEDQLEGIIKIKEIFDNHCKLIQDQYIFNYDTSIHEIYDYNKTK